MANEDNHNINTNDKDEKKQDTQISSLSPQLDPETYRTAFIHTATILFVLVCGACALLAYRVLEPFLRSILWSILAGAFLFPFKSHLTITTKYYISQIDKESYLLIYGLFVLLPIRTIDKTIESIFPFSIKKWKELLLIIVFLLLIVFIKTGLIYDWITTISDDLVHTTSFLLRAFESTWITTCVIAYLIAVLTIYDSSPLTEYLLNLIAVPVWFILLINVSQYLAVTYRVAVVCLAILLTIIGFIVDLREHFDRNSTSSNNSHNDQDQTSMFTNLINLFRQIKQYYFSKQEEQKVSDMTEVSASSTPYFQFLLWSLVAIKIYQFYWYPILVLFIVFIYKTSKFILFGIYHFLTRKRGIQDITQKSLRFLQIRQNVFTPAPLHGLLRFLIKGDKKLNHCLQTSIDYLVSACMIITLFIAVIFVSIFLILQIHHESLHMIKLTSNLINETIVLHPSFQYMLPDKENMSKLMDTAVNNFYFVGRNWIANQVNELSADSLSNSKLKKDVLLLWDQLYEYMSNSSTLFLPDKNRSSSIYSSANYRLNKPNFDFYLNDIYQLIQNNIGLLRTVFDSIWTNATLLVTLCTTIISLLFTGGSALLNFLVSFFVFVTLLFYLLSQSDQPVYQPTVWLNNALAIGGKDLGKAVHDAVTSVFVASLKIAAFYGLYTYLLHTIVGSNLVFLPAVIASICAVTLKSYWAALPGCLDLWLVQQRPLAGLTLLLGQIAPVYVVDTAIYSEVKGGGHQYLTALAIAGGVYYRGIEGALIGPIILCCLLVGIRLYNEKMKTTLLTNRIE